MLKTHPKGMLDIDADIKARRALADILRNSETVVKDGYILEIGKRTMLTGDKVSIVRLAERTWDRNFTVAEARLIYTIRGRP